MAIKSHVPTLWYIVLQLLLLLATTGFCEVLPQDVKDNLHFDDSDDTVKILSTRTDEEDDQADYNAAHCKGGRLLDMLTWPTAQIKQSPFLNIADATDNGWSVPAANANGNPIPDDVDDVYTELGISVANTDNPEYEWKQQTASTTGTQNAYGVDEGSSTTNNFVPAGQPYGATYAHYDNQINPSGGMILCADNRSPASQVAWDADLGPAPPLGQLSDMLWLQWQAAVQRTRTYRRIRYILQHWIANPTSLAVIRTVERMPGQSLQAWPGRTYSMTAADEVEQQIAQALLGTPNGATGAYLLGQHRRQLGNRRIEKVTLWTGEKEEDIMMLFYIIDAAST